MPVTLITSPSGECLHINEARNDRRIDDNADDSKLRGLIAAARQAAESRTRQQLMHARWQLIINGFPGFGFAACNSIAGIPPSAIRLPHCPLVAVEKIEWLGMDSAWQTIAFPHPDYIVSGHQNAPFIAPAFGKIWPIPLPQAGSVKVTYTAGYASSITTGGALAAGAFRVTGPVSWAVGDRVNFYNSGGVLPAPLDADQTYLIASAASGAYTLTDESGAAIIFTQAGTGRNFIGVVPDGIRAWMLLRVGSLMENREEVAIGQRLTMVEPGFVDGLLDPYITGY
jgi:uncharacterized phiE125 gp8 family phage protein